ncbi:PaaI family thioesterase [Antrihabitans spumae]|uniref:Acyl-coenzyme A thioesterase THEM4 n=1 Tax=Antrihabitans spumae TaxID=3373370 RepID=A0ABW7JWS5_9NOCA
MSEQAANGQTSVDEEYEHHGGFPKFTAATPGPNFGPFIQVMRTLQDLAVSIDAPDDVLAEARTQAEALAALLAPYEAREGEATGGRVIGLPGRGSLLMLPWMIEKFDAEGVRSRGVFRRYHLGGNAAAHGGVLPLLFDDIFGMTVHAAGRPISRTAYLHINYRKVTPLNVPLVIEGRVDRVEGRKAFVSARLSDEAGTLLADSDALMVQLLPGQQ